MIYIYINKKFINRSNINTLFKRNDYFNKLIEENEDLDFI